ncbi:MAG: peptide chain release factor N(5)-glutamine methyltransferase [Marinicellaceae bacterium]
MNKNKLFNEIYQKFNLERREVELIVCHVLKINSAKLIIYDESISESQHKSILKFCQQRHDGKPFAYITGIKDFWSLELKVNQHTLIPRPETETLVELALEKTHKDFNGCILDLGTGSGAIALSLAKERPKAKITAVDFSSECIAIAEFNKNKHAIENADFILGNWFDNLENNKYDIIVSNPPYVEENDEHLKDLSYEPMTALTAKNKGLADLFHIITNAQSYMKKGGWLILEHGYNQHERVQQHLLANHYKNVKSYKDLAGTPRITTAEF